MGSSFCGFLIPLIIWRLGIGGYNLAKPPTFAKKFSFAKLYRVLPDCLRFRRKVCEICSLQYFIFGVMNKMLFAYYGSMEGSWKLAVLVGMG